MSKENNELTNELKQTNQQDPIEFILERAEMAESLYGNPEATQQAMEEAEEVAEETQLEEVPEELTPPSVLGNIIAGAVVAGGLNAVTQLVLAEDEGLNLISTASASGGGAIIGGAMAKMGRSYGTTAVLATAIGGATGYFWRNNSEVKELLEESNL